MVDFGRGGAGHFGFGAGSALDALVDHLAHIGIVRAQGQLQVGMIGNDVRHRPGVERANGDHAEFPRVFLARDHALHIGDEMRALDDRVDAAIWHRPVRANADEADIDRIDRRCRRTLLDMDSAGQAGIDMRGKAIVGAWETA